MVLPNFCLPGMLDLDTVDSPRDLLVNFGGKFGRTDAVPPFYSYDGLGGLDSLARFPGQLTGDLCWDRTSFGGSSKSHVLQFTEEDVDAIRVAINKFNELGLDPPFLEPATFPLPEELGNRLRSVTSVLQEGIGFTVLRGLNPQDYCAKDIIIVYAGILSYIGDQRITNAFGMSIEHIRDASRDRKPKMVEVADLEPAKLSQKMEFHADRFMADILGLYVKEKSLKGGEQYIASFWSIYNELMRTNPSILQTLARDWAWPPPEDAGLERMTGPVIFERDGKVFSQLIWAPFSAHPEYLTPEMERALHAVNNIARKISIKVDCQPGDIQLINNLAILHAREEFEDSDTQKRHYLRMGIRDRKQRWMAPAGYERQFDQAYATAMEDQIMPVVDSDPWNTTSTASSHHG